MFDHGSRTAGRWFRSAGAATELHFSILTTLAFVKMIVRLDIEVYRTAGSAELAAVLPTRRFVNW